jgi:multidrug efflux system membrane fusion protein
VPAIQHGNQGTFVYIVDTKNNTVSMRDVTIGTTSIDGSNAEVQSGLSPGDVVVVDGVDKLQNGSKIMITPSGSPNGAAPAASPAGSPSGSPGAQGSHSGHHRSASSTPS